MARKEQSHANRPKIRKLKRKKNLKATIDLPMPYNEKEADAFLESLGRLKVAEGRLQWTPNENLPSGAKKQLRRSVKSLNRMTEQKQFKITSKGKINRATPKYVAVRPPPPPAPSPPPPQGASVKFYWWGMKVYIPFSDLCDLTSSEALTMYFEICHEIPAPYGTAILLYMLVYFPLVRVANNNSGGKGVIFYVSYGGQIWTLVPAANGYHPCPGRW